MNFRRKTIIGSVVAAFVIAYFGNTEEACAVALASPDSHASSSAAFSKVASPKVPDKVHFADQTIDLDDDLRWERFDRELSAMAYTHGNTLLTLKRANRYFPVMAPILERNGVPQDMLYLAAIESYLNPRAVSPAKAAGMWQFMPSTAKEYGLEVNDYVDERYDVAKATQAACRYLKNAYARYGNWESVAASYNAGMGRISNELSNQQAESAYDLWLPEETMRYVFRLLAMKTIMEHPKTYGYILTPDQLYHPIETRIVEVSEPVDDWAQWALANGSDYRTLRELNPWIRSKQLPNKTGKTYQVSLPAKNALSRKKQSKSVYNKAWVGVSD
ncbi:MAG: lytic transglycosylase domain-containing protein [Duncaniella sp.]|nr:lytic transglycosylase domain-containing protein [Duncaniella sp.]